MQDIVLYQKSTYKFIIVSGCKQTILKENHKISSGLTMGTIEHVDSFISIFTKQILYSFRQAQSLF